MSEWVVQFEHTVVWLFWVGVAAAAVTFGAVVIERIAYGLVSLRDERLRRLYTPLIQRALEGDDRARFTLVASPARHRIALAWLLVLPLIDERNSERIAGTRRLADAMSLTTIADRLLRSRWWWRRARALRGLGLLRYSDYTGAIITALDDPNPDVRGAALDALSDLKDPRSLPAVIVRMHDPSLYRGRRAQALAAFGTQCESLILDLSDMDPDNLPTYALVLSRCGTVRSRPALCRWTSDERATVRAAAFEGLAHVGLDEHAARLSIDALTCQDIPVRAMAARALRHWATADTARHLARRLDDEWPVAVQAAQSLRSMNDAGMAVLQAQATRQDLAGILARQMLWESSMTW